MGAKLFHDLGLLYGKILHFLGIAQVVVELRGFRMLMKTKGRERDVLSYAHWAIQ